MPLYHKNAKLLQIMEVTKTETVELEILDSLNNWDSLKRYTKQKLQHSGFKKYSQNISWMFSAKILSMVISFVATAYTARHLGPTNYGQLSYAISFVGLSVLLHPLVSIKYSIETWSNIQKEKMSISAQHSPYG